MRDSCDCTGCGRKETEGGYIVVGVRRRGGGCCKSIEYRVGITELDTKFCGFVYVEFFLCVLMSAFVFYMWYIHRIFYCAVCVFSLYKVFGIFLSIVTGCDGVDVFLV